MLDDKIKQVRECEIRISFLSDALYEAEQAVKRAEKKRMTAEIRLNYEKRHLEYLTETGEYARENF